MQEKTAQTILKRTNPKTGDEISALGYGCMRFKRKLGSFDVAAADRQVAAALAAGVNYFDTAYIYPGNEKLMGSLLSKTDALGKRRDRVFLATKLPTMFVKTRGDMDKLLGTSLSRLETDHIDYYLFHNLNSFTGWERLVSLGAHDFIEKAKADGRIRRIGFSWHGNLHDFRRVIDAYDWEFCQIQYNYLDENFQAGTEGLLYAAEKGIPVIVMEPLRGGALANRVPKEAARLFASHSQGWSPAEWGLRWILNRPEVLCVLSGMNDLSQIEENARIASDALPNALSPAELETVAKAAEIFHEKLKVNCTGCSYCLPCPYGVDIPTAFAYYNSYALFGKFNQKLAYALGTRAAGGKSHKASLCQNCGACAKKCPQHLPIPSLLKDAANTLESPALSAFTKIAGLFIK